MGTLRKIKILIVDDSALIRSILKQVLNDTEELEIIGEASNGLNGSDMNRQLEPDLVIMDINMPVMDGLEATKKIMSERAVPIIIFSSAADSQTGFNAVSAGAVDIIEKPDIDVISSRAFISDLVAKIKAATAADSVSAGIIKSEKKQTVPKFKSADIRAVVIGASTGGPLAVKEVLTGLPAAFPVGIALVQHLEENFDQGYADWLNELSELKVRLAEENDCLTPGEVIIAPVNSHLTVRQNKVYLEDTPPVLNQKPAVDVLFSTAADNYGSSLLGILLTGMGRDGADGCLRIRQKGGYTLVQDEATSAIFGMPKAAIEAGAASEIIPLPKISGRMLELVKGI